MNILVPNLGSTSLKYQLIEFPSETTLARGRLERIGLPGGDVTDHREAVAQVFELPHPIDGVGFKTVHGGPNYRGTFRVDNDLLAAMREYETAAPLHNGIYLSALEIFRSLRPELPLIAVFETSFHRTMPDEASHYGVPGDWVEQFGVRKYGFHGASHRYVSERVPEILGTPSAELQLVSCHLGGSSSICAVDGGRSVDTTMGFSAQSGVEHATRHGDLDVFAVLAVMDRLHLSTEAMREQLLSGGGLAGLSGIAGGDVRDLENAAGEGNPRARLALDVLAYEIRKTVGAFAAAMGGLDALAFTGGIGENSVALRAAVCRELEFLGIRLDPVENLKGSGDRVISYPHRPVKVVVLATNEELIVARETRTLLEAQPR